jgi:hypothetical protein
LNRRAQKRIFLANNKKMRFLGEFMRIPTAVAGTILVLAFTGTPSHAGLRDDIASCAAIADDGERLACFDGLAETAKSGVSTLSPAAADALKKEFRFNSRLMTGPFSFRLAVSGDLKISRPTAAAREVENLVRRVGKALADNSDWGVIVTVHGAQITFSRGNPYTGAELLAQAQTGMARTGLAGDRYKVTKGADATPVLWDDGRVRSVNEHIIVEVTELGSPLTR